MNTTINQFATRTAEFARTPRARRLGLWAVGLIVLFALIGFLVAPPIVRHQLEKRLGEALHRDVTIQRVRINPFALSATINGFALQERGGGGPVVTFDELYVNASLASIFRLAPVLDAVRLVKPQVRIVRNADKTYNFQDLIDEAMAGPPGPTPKFSLNNIEIVAGGVEFDDRPENEKHALTELRAGVPFISSLPYATEINVQPALSMLIDGTPFALEGETKPFHETRETTLRLSLDNLALPKYVDYVPVPLRFKLVSGSLDAKLTISLSTIKEQLRSLTIAGTAELAQLDLREQNDAPLLKLDKLAADVEALDLVGNKASLRSVRIDAPELQVTRRKDGSVNLAQLAPAPTPASAPAKPEAVTQSKPEAKPFTFSIGAVTLAGGRVHVADEVPARAFKTTLQNLNLDVKDLGNAPSAKAHVQLAFDTDSKESFKHEGTLSLAPLAAEGKFEIAALQLGRLYPYYEEAVNLEVRSGTLDMASSYTATLAGDKLDARLSGAGGALKALQLHFIEDRDPLWRVPLLEVAGGEVDLAKRTATFESIRAREAIGDVRRARDGSLHYARILKTHGASTPTTNEAPWTMLLKRLEFEQFTVNYEDRATPTPVKAQAAQLMLTMENLSTAKGERATLALRTTLDKRGTLSIAGPLTIEPLAANLRVETKGIGLVPFQPYWADLAQVVVTDGALSTRGNLVLATTAAGAPKASYKGEVNLINFASVEKATSEDLLKWKSLFLGGIDVETEPLRVAVGEITLADFYSRLVINADGTLNLQQLARRNEQPQQAAPPVAESKGTPPDVRIGKITLQGGNVNFSDFFIQPNYSANLTGIGGTVSTLTAGTPGDVALRGQIDNAAPVEIDGKIDPLAKDLYLDIKASARDIELPPLSPYSVKYAGYGITRGKLSVDVKYLVENRKLSAENHVYLDQLTFGDKVDSPTATELPVLLAVALLKDRNGVIDVNLPISGSLDDPQFSVGGIIVKVIVNLIVKAVTAPFALLGSLFGGGEELAYLEFPPGVARLDDADIKKLENLSKALNDRPGLRLDVGGRVDPERDRQGLKQVTLQRKVKAQKLKERVAGGASAGSVDDIQIDGAEYPKYLKRAYDDETFAKPRNAIGLTKDLPPDEMEKLILANTTVGEEDLRQLANARAQAAKLWLVEAGKVPTERIFLVAPQMSADGVKDKGSPMRVDFSLK